MKKIKAKIYAEVLYQAVSEASDIDLALKNFAKFLLKNNQLSSLNQIIKQFIKVYNEKENQADVFVVSAFPLSAEEEKLLKNFVADYKKVSKVNFENKIDKSLLGGSLIKIDDLQLDATLKGQLEFIKNNIK